MNHAKQKAVLEHLREIRKFRETKAGATLGRVRNLARQAEASAREKTALRLAHGVEAATMEQEILATMAGKTINTSRLQYLEAFQQRTAAIGMHHWKEDCEAQSSFDQAMEKLNVEQSRYRQVYASKTKLEELIDRLNKSSDNDGWPV